MDVVAHLKDLCAAPGLSAYEAPVREVIQAAWAPLTAEQRVDRVGSLIAVKPGSGKPPRKRVMLAAHMDAIGLMVTRVESGFIGVAEIGGLDPRVLPGQPVLVHGRETLPGVIASTPPHLLQPEDRDKVVELENLLVDTGRPPAEMSKLVKVGDLISFAQTPFEMQGEMLVAKSLDNRASVAAVTACLEALRSRDHVWDVVAAATAQEEETFLGALGAAFGVMPDIALVVDVTFASGPGLPEHKTFPLGQGPTLGFGPNIHPKLHSALADIAAKKEIPHHIEVMPMHSGTDAFAIQVSREGIPTAVLGIPLRNMHTPVEIVSTKDVERAGRLLAEFICSLSADFLDTLKWD